MRALDAEETLLALLARSGVDVVEVHYAYEGRGDDARAAWEAFKVVAELPADEPFEDDAGDLCHVDVTADGDRLLFETSVGERRPAKGWRSLGEPAEPSAFTVSFTRQFSFDDADGEYLWMNGLYLTVEFAPHPQLTGLEPAQIWGCGGPPWGEDQWRRRGESPKRFAAALDWIGDVERSQPFALAFGDHTPLRFILGQSDY
jgi:hypothetical protein